MIPKEVWTGHSCDYSNMRIFGCDAYALISKDQRSKLDPRSKEYVFVGYGDGVKGYKLWDLTAHKLIIRNDVVFDESSLIKSDLVDVGVRQEHVPQVQKFSSRLNHLQKRRNMKKFQKKKMKMQKISRKLWICLNHL
jgi:hypothetical protein